MQAYSLEHPKLHGLISLLDSLQRIFLEDGDAPLQVYDILAHIYNEVRVVLSIFGAFYVHKKIAHVAWETIIIKLNFVLFCDLAVLVGFELIVLGGGLRLSFIFE